MLLQLATNEFRNTLDARDPVGCLKSFKSFYVFFLDYLKDTPNADIDFLITELNKTRMQSRRPAFMILKPGMEYLHNGSYFIEYEVNIENLIRKILPIKFNQYFDSVFSLSQADVVSNVVDKCFEIWPSLVGKLQIFKRWYNSNLNKYPNIENHEIFLRGLSTGRYASIRAFFEKFLKSGIDYIRLNDIEKIAFPEFVLHSYLNTYPFSVAFNDYDPTGNVMLPAVIREMLMNEPDINLNKFRSNLIVIAELNKLANKKGFHSIEGQLEKIQEPFIRKLLQLIVEGVDPAAIRSIGERWSESIHSDLSRKLKVILKGSLELNRGTHPELLKQLLTSIADAEWNLLELEEFISPDFYKEALRILKILSEKSQKEGVLALEDELDHLKTSFMRHGIAMVMDGTDPDLIKEILESYINSLVAKLKQRSELLSEGILSVQTGESPRLVKDKVDAFLVENRDGQSLFELAEFFKELAIISRRDGFSELETIVDSRPALLRYLVTLCVDGISDTDLEEIGKRNSDFKENLQKMIFRIYLDEILKLHSSEVSSYTEHYVNLIAPASIFDRNENRETFRFYDFLRHMTPFKRDFKKEDVPESIFPDLCIAKEVPRELFLEYTDLKTSIEFEIITLQIYLQVLSVTASVEVPLIWTSDRIVMNSLHNMDLENRFWEFMNLAEKEISASRETYRGLLKEKDRLLEIIEDLAFVFSESTLRQNYPKGKNNSSVASLSSLLYIGKEAWEEIFRKAGYEVFLMGLQKEDSNLRKVAFLSQGQRLKLLLEKDNTIQFPEEKTIKAGRELLDIANSLLESGLIAIPGRDEVYVNYREYEDPEYLPLTPAEKDRVLFFQTIISQKLSSEELFKLIVILEKKVLTGALMIVSKKTREVIYDILSEDQLDDLKLEMELLSGITVKEALKEQSEIVNLVLELVQDGRFKNFFNPHEILFRNKKFIPFVLPDPSKHIVRELLSLFDSLSVSELFLLFSSMDPVDIYHIFPLFTVEEFEKLSTCRAPNFMKAKESWESGQPVLLKHSLKSALRALRLSSLLKIKKENLSEEKISELEKLI